MTQVIMTDSPLGRLHIDRSDKTPLYRQISAQLEALIAEGAWDHSEALPSDTVLSARLGTSTMTVRQAIHQLVAKGLVIRIQGRGTFLLPRTMSIDSRRLCGFSEDARSRSFTPTSRILAFEQVTPSAVISEYLGVSRHKTVLHIRRLRMLNGVPAVLMTNYVAYTAITQKELEETGSLYAVLTQKGITPVGANETIRAIGADEEDARLLNVQPGTPLLLVERNAFGADGKPIEYSLSKTRGDLYSYSVRVRRDSSE